MSPAEKIARSGLWLACGGMMILAARHVITFVDDARSAEGLALTVGTIAGYMVTCSGLCLCIGFRSRRSPTALLPAPAALSSASSSSPSAALAEISRAMLCRFSGWVEEDHGSHGVLHALDQLLREMLVEHMGAGRVRCFEVSHCGQELRSLSRQGDSSDEPTPAVQDALLAHVAESGTEFDSSRAEDHLLALRLASQSSETWDWIVPLREFNRTIGLVAVGRVQPAALSNYALRETIGLLAKSFWTHASCLDQLRLAERTDKASGVLTRADFFELAARTLDSAHAENEPLVLAALGIEGLRRLDDRGLWEERDALIETMGRLIARRMRTDDVIGRFSDDRFVMLLRRLDGGLGKLIVQKLAATAEELIDSMPELRQGVHVRFGLSESAGHAPLESLLVRAFEAIDVQRRAIGPDIAKKEPPR